MAEAVLFSVASKLLSTISSPAFEFAYEKGLSIWGAMDELDKLKTTIETVQAVLIDAERKQEGSAAVKNWIRRVSDVLYEADDLFDEVITDGMLKQRAKAYKPLRKVQVSLIKLNPIVSRNSIAKKVKAIRKSLSDISTDMDGFQFVICHKEDDIHTSRSGREREQKGWFVDSKKVIGRDVEKKSILEMMLLKELDKSDEPVVISIVGIGGMGKTTLAQLVYNDDQVKNIFPHRWFACISDTTDEKEVIGKIFQSICDETNSDRPVGQLQTRIRGSIKGKKFLLVLDNVWDDNRSNWEDRLSLLSGSAKGSKIIVTTRSSSVGVAMGALKTHHLGGLSDDDSWKLFQRVAFHHGKENDKKWVDVGREIVKKCANVPLAIRSIGGLLYTKNTLREWESIRDSQLSNQTGDPVLKALKLSYDPLPSNLKHCFAYCSLYPKDYRYEVQSLIYLWISQGYIKIDNEMQTVEEVGHSYLMDLLRRGFFQEVVEDRFGEIESCKMHDLLHDLAQNVAGEEIQRVPMPSSNQSKHNARHVSIDYEGSREFLAPLLDINRVRSVVLIVNKQSGLALDQQFMNMERYVQFSDLTLDQLCTDYELALDQQFTNSNCALDQIFTNSKCLRALCFFLSRMDNLSSCIGELKHLRYLDLSYCRLESLPDSITKLLNLTTLNLKYNGSLRELPDGFRELINLRYLNIGHCRSLKHMPPGMGELESLQYLSLFKIGKAKEGVKASGLDALAGLKHLKGKLEIVFEKRIEDWNSGDDDSRWKLPISPNEVEIRDYPGVRVPHWDRANHLSLLPNLRALTLSDCLKVKYLPPLSCLPNLMFLHLLKMDELEYMEEEGSISNASFFPRLEELELVIIPKLKGWWREVEATSSDHPMFLSLSTLRIFECPNLESIPLCPPSLLSKLQIQLMNGDLSDGVMQQLLSNKGGSNSPFPSSLQEIDINSCDGITSFSDQQFTSLRSFSIKKCGRLNNLHMVSPHLHSLAISSCYELVSVQLEAPVVSLLIEFCYGLKILHIAHPNVLEELKVTSVQVFDLWRLNWDSFPNLRKLEVHWINKNIHWEIPDCLRHLQDIGQLHMNF